MSYRDAELALNADRQRQRRRALAASQVARVALADVKAFAKGLSGNGWSVGLRGVHAPKFAHRELQIKTKFAVRVTTRAPRTCKVRT